MKPVFFNTCEFSNICELFDKEKHLCVIIQEEVITENDKKIRFACTNYHYLKCFPNPTYRVGCGSVNDQYEFNK